jgi:hypothetical protein
VATGPHRERFDCEFPNLKLPSRDFRLVFLRESDLVDQPVSASLVGDVFRTVGDQSDRAEIAGRKPGPRVRSAVTQPIQLPLTARSLHVSTAGFRCPVLCIRDVACFPLLPGFDGGIRRRSGIDADPFDTEFI